MSDWVILRTSGRHTLPLAESLNRGGFEVWTPAVEVRRRVQRSKDRVHALAPLLPTYVFAASGRVADLLDLSRDPPKDMPYFSVFHFLDRIPLIADTELDPLRHSETRLSGPRRVKREYSPGDPVSVTDGPWLGLSGVVEQSQGRYAIVLFGRTSVRVATFLLHSGVRVAA